MARIGSPLDAGDPLAPLSFDTIAHGRLELPQAFKRWGVVLLYRGHDCGYCARQLAAFQQGLPELEYAHIQVVAVSADDEDGARRMEDVTGATFPIGYGLPVEDTAKRLGTYYDPEQGVLHSTGFVVKPDGTIAVASYSTGQIGRLVWEDVVRLVAFWDKDA